MYTLYLTRSLIVLTIRKDWVTGNWGPEGSCIIDMQFSIEEVKTV